MWKSSTDYKHCFLCKILDNSQSVVSSQLPDILVASGVNHCCTLLFYLCRCNAILKVLYFQQSAELSCFVVSAYRLIYSKQNVGEYGLIESIHSNCLPTSSSGMYSLPAAEDMSTYDCQKRILVTVNALYQYLTSIRQCFTSRHSGLAIEGLFIRYQFL